MTALRGHIPAGVEPAAIGVHSLDHFTLQVPDLAAAERFYASFGLNVRPDGDALILQTFGQAEYSCDIDYVPADRLWPARHHADEDSFYLWGPEPPADFAVNHEAAVN